MYCPLKKDRKNSSHADGLFLGKDHVRLVKLEGESPLRALVRRTVSEGQGVPREIESEEYTVPQKLDRIF